MNLSFNLKLAEKYKAPPQIARILTESWVSENMFCPHCGNTSVSHFGNNKPVDDFYCPVCKADYELKSSCNKFSSKITDGAYDTMIEKIMGHTTPDFFFMNYSSETMTVNNFVFVPKHFFTPDVIEKRKPLSDKARRAGWVGCNILINKIPAQGIIHIISNGIAAPCYEVVSKVKQSMKLEIKDITSRGWLFDVLNCLNEIEKQEFSLNEVYQYEDILSTKHPENNNVPAKIRQQLQLLRDRGYIEFLGRGVYRKL